MLKEACDPSGCIELRRVSQALTLVDLDLMRSALFPQKALYNMGMRQRDNGI